MFVYLLNYNYTVLEDTTRGHTREHRHQDVKVEKSRFLEVGIVHSEFRASLVLICHQLFCKAYISLCISSNTLYRCFNCRQFVSSKIAAYSGAPAPPPNGLHWCQEGFVISSPTAPLSAGETLLALVLFSGLDGSNNFELPIQKHAAERNKTNLTQCAKAFSLLAYFKNDIHCSYHSTHKTTATNTQGCYLMEVYEYSEKQAFVRLNKLQTLRFYSHANCSEILFFHWSKNPC